MRAKTIIDAGNDGTHTLEVGAGKLRYRGLTVIAQSTGTAASVYIVVRNGSATGEVIDAHSFSGAVNEWVDIHHFYEVDGIEVDAGVYVTVIVTNATAGTIFGALLFDEVIP